MPSRLTLSTLALMAGLSALPVPCFAQSAASSNNKVLSQANGGFNVTAVEQLLKEGDKAIAKGDLETAKKSYDKARDASKELIAFYRDLSGAFRGLDARIPREMDGKGRKALTVLAKSNLRLAALFRKQNTPEIAVPVLVEVVRLMTPAKPEGQQAYQRLVELGFADTPYAAARRSGRN